MDRWAGVEGPSSSRPMLPIGLASIPRKMHVVGLLTKVILCLNILQVSCDRNITYRGCAFEQLPKHQSIEPESTPLHIEVDILINGLREGSGSGDFFGVDAE